MVSTCICTKQSKIHSKLEKFTAKNCQLMDFTIKLLRLSVQTIPVIQGGDGGMEYAMCTLILGQASLKDY
jgi:hypothetical protein